MRNFVVMVFAVGWLTGCAGMMDVGGDLWQGAKGAGHAWWGGLRESARGIGVGREAAVPHGRVVVREGADEVMSDPLQVGGGRVMSIYGGQPLGASDRLNVPLVVSGMEAREVLQLLVQSIPDWPVVVEGEPRGRFTADVDVLTRDDLYRVVGLLGCSVERTQTWDIVRCGGGVVEVESEEGDDEAAEVVPEQVVRWGRDVAISRVGSGVTEGLVRLVGRYADAECSGDEGWVVCSGRGDSSLDAQDMLGALSDLARPRVELVRGASEATVSAIASAVGEDLGVVEVEAGVVVHGPGPRVAELVRVVGDLGRGGCVMGRMVVPGTVEERAAVRELVERVVGEQEECGGIFEIGSALVVRANSGDQLDRAMQAVRQLNVVRVDVVFEVRLFSLGSGWPVTSAELARRQYRVPYRGGQVEWSVRTKDRIETGESVGGGDSSLVLRETEERQFGVRIAVDAGVVGATASGSFGWSDTVAVPGGTRGVECEAGVVVGSVPQVICSYDVSAASLGAAFLVDDKPFDFEASGSMVRYEVSVRVEIPGVTA